MQKPTVYFTTEYKKREGFYYKQPYDYCNGIELTFDVISNFKDLFGVDFSTAKKESSAYNNALKESLFHSELWRSDEAKIVAFNKIHQFNLNGKSKTGSTTTPLFPFEIFMMNDGFEMLSFCEMNAIDPAVSILCESRIGDELTNPRGLKYNRCYLKGDNFIYLAFGIEINQKKTQFYFKTSNSNYTFQVDNDIENYQDAINGKLKPLEKININQ